jgi:TrmH family RNA methyltransferase
MISSIQNDTIKKIYGLIHQQKLRKKEGLFVVEGVKLLQEIPEELTHTIVVSKDFYEQNNILMKAFNQQQLLVVSENVFKHLSTTQTPQGVLIVVKKPSYTLEEMKIDEKALIIILENIQDPGNIGTIIRTADAVNATCVLASTGTVDIYNPKVIRATMGSIFRLPIVQNIDVVKTLEVLKKKGVQSYGAHLGATAYHYHTDFKQKTCLVIGNEGAGLSDEATDNVSDLVKIPILGKAESLNASVAAAVLMYEVIRQREA